LTVNDKSGNVVTGVAFVVVLVVVRMVVRGVVRVLLCVPVPVALTSTETESASAWNLLEFVSRPPLFFSWVAMAATTMSGVRLVANLRVLCTTIDPGLLEKPNDLI